MIRDALCYTYKAKKSLFVDEKKSIILAENEITKKRDVTEAFYNPYIFPSKFEVQGSKTGIIEIRTSWRILLIVLKKLTLEFKKMSKH